MWSSTVGTRDSSLAQLVRLAAPSVGRSSWLQRAEMSLNVPLVRIRPPSEPSKIWVGLDGLTAITCWSGWIESGGQRHLKGAVTRPNVNCAPSSEHQLAARSWASNVRSVNVRLTPAPVTDASGSPAVVE